jgi:hypothetical protein
MSIFGIKTAPKPPPEKPIKVILEEQEDVIIRNSTMS